MCFLARRELFPARGQNEHEIGARLLMPMLLLLLLAQPAAAAPQDDGFFNCTSVPCASLRCCCHRGAG